MSNKSPAAGRHPDTALPKHARKPRAGSPLAAAHKTGRALGVLPQLLGYQIRLAQRAVFADFAEAMGSEDISPGLFGMLVIIESNPGLKQTELARAAHLDRSSIVPVVDKLEARGLVARRTSSEDRRVNGLWLTEQGGALLRRLKRRVATHERRLMRNLTAQERAQLVELLGKILPERR
jgi:DNA-binding MarR family transcriptional regulator